MKVLVIAAGCLLLGGCAGSVISDGMKGPAVLAQEDDAYCRSLGVQAGSDAYVQCRLTVDQNRETRHASQRRRSNAMLAWSAQQEANRQARRPIVCNRLGGAVVCN